MDNIPVLEAPIGRAQIRDAAQTLRRYREGKTHLEQRLIANEQFWKLRHWEQLRPLGNDGDPRPVSGWLVNVILNRHADAMDAYPEPVCLPRAADDAAEAARLTKILPAVLRQNRFRRTYSAVMYDKLKSGCGAYGVFWDGGKLHGLGDVSIRRVSLLHLFWEPGVDDIQRSRHLFCTELVDEEALRRRYPHLPQGRGADEAAEISRYLYDDRVDTSGKRLVVDWYYHRGETLHYCKFTGDTVLFATENDPAWAQRGWYDHGLYPFVLDTLYPEEGTPCGFGFVDLCRDPQKYIDVLNQAILKNTVAGATPRFFIRGDGCVNEAEFADWTKPFVHTNGSLGQDAILPVQSAPLPPTALHVLQQKIQEMRETSGNTNSAAGIADTSVTAASAIAALQEASGKLSRDMNGGTYDAFEEVVLLCIELIRQFYDLPRTFRITGERGEATFTDYTNAALKPHPLGTEFGVELGLRTPVFDIDVVPRNETRYTQAACNELALTLYRAGFFDPRMAAQALAAADMMDFKGKEAVVRRIRENAAHSAARAAAAEAAAQADAAADAAAAAVNAPGAAAAKAGAAWRFSGGENAVTARSRAAAQSVARPR